MNCFPCCNPKKSLSKREHDSPHAPQEPATTKPPDMKKKPDEQTPAEPAEIKAQNYTFRELATATKNFRQECLIGEGGFGRIYKGIIPSTGKVVAVKQLDRHGMESSKEFLGEVAELSQLHHENLVNLIGYCADGEQRLLVYELFAGRNLEDRLFEHKAGEGPLNWFDRMRIIAASSKGIEYLHETTNPPVIFGDLKASNILVDDNLESKLCDFGMTKITNGDKSAPPRLMGTYGYSAPEYTRSGQLTVKSDVYSFGVIMLEVITGRRAIDTTRPNEEQNLVSWAQPLFKDPKRYPDMADPLLNKNFPEKDLNQVVAIASMCLQEEAEARPLISDVVTALSFLSIPPPVTTASKSKKSCASESRRESEYGSESGSESGSEVSGTMSHRSSVSESQNGSDSQLLPALSAKASRKSSRKSKKENHHSDSGDGNASPKRKNSRKHSHKVNEKTSEKELGHKSSKKSSEKELGHKSSKKSSEKELGHKSSKKSPEKELGHKSSKKSPEKELGHKSSKKETSEEEVTEKSSKKHSSKDLSKKSSRKSSIKALSQKISRKSAAGILSHKSSKASQEGSYSSSCRSSSVASEDEHVYSQRSSMSLSPGGISFGLNSSESAHSDHNSSSRSENESIHYGSRSSIGSDAGSEHSH